MEVWKRSKEIGMNQGSLINNEQYIYILQLLYNTVLVYIVKSFKCGAVAPPKRQRGTRDEHSL